MLSAWLALYPLFRRIQSHQRQTSVGMISSSAAALEGHLSALHPKRMTILAHAHSFSHATEDLLSHSCALERERDSKQVQVYVASADSQTHEAEAILIRDSLSPLFTHVASPLYHKATRASGVSRERKQSRQASRQQTPSPRGGKQRRRRRATAAVTRDPGTSDRPEDRECSRSSSDSLSLPHSSGRTGERCTSRQKEMCCAS